MHEPLWNDGLGGTAYDIADSNAPRLRVLAGPGTGKTFAMKRRVMRLLQEGANPKQILVCTFTRTAAHDVAREIEALGIEGAKDVKAGTLHAYCFSVLRRSAVLELTGRVPRPVISFEQRFLLQDLQKQFGGIRKSEARLQAFNAAWARLQSDEPRWPSDPVDQAFQDALQSWLTFHRAMLVGELVPVTLRYLRDNPLADERKAFDYILVDEFQDLNRAEQVLITLLAENAWLTIIGDEDQSIYSFKHAHPEGISTFHEDHPGTHDEKLTECRRCPTLVVELAKTLIAKNTTASGRPLIPKDGNPAGEVRIVQWSSLTAEAKGIAEFVKQRIDAGEVEPGKVLILAPRRQFGYAVRDALRTRAVHAHSFLTEESLEGDPKDLIDCQAQQAFALLTLLSNPEDRVGLRCWCGFGHSALAEPAWRRIRQHAESTAESPRAVLTRLAAGELSLPYTEYAVERFKLLLEREKALKDVKGMALVESLFPQAESWADPLSQIAADAENPEEPFTPGSLLDVIRPGVTQPELPTDVDYVRVMSLHKSKGLTAKLVVITGCIQGAVPRMAEDGTPETERKRMLEEQRRLFYVALTRATDTLVISSTTHLPLHTAHKMRVPVGAGGRAIPSQFIGELGPKQPKAIPGDQLLSTSQAGVTFKQAPNTKKFSGAEIESEVNEQ